MYGDRIVYKEMANELDSPEINGWLYCFQFTAIKLTISLREIIIYIPKNWGNVSSWSQEARL